MFDGMVMGESKRSLPDGSYNLLWKGMEKAPAKEFNGEMMAEGKCWLFEVANGPQQGRKVQRITGSSPTQNNACGKMIAGLMGRMPQPGEPIDLQPCVGRTYIGIVSKGKVESIALPPQ